MEPIRAVVVLNPRAGRGRGGRSSAKLRSLLDAAVERARAQGIDASCTVEETTCAGLAMRTGEKLPGSASDIAARALAGGATRIAAAGGDGTVSEVANSLAGTGHPLAIIPMGTGNDLGRMIGLGANPEAGVDALFFGEPKAVDVARTGRGVFVNAASFGFDAVIAHKVNNRVGDTVGLPAYLLSTMECLLKLKSHPLEIKVDGVVHKEDAILCAVANSRSYGGGLRIAPEASMTDGLLDVVVVRSVSALQLLVTLPRLFAGTHLSHPKVRHMRGRVVEVSSSEAVLAQADGEMMGQTPLTCEISPKSLILMHPASRLG
jgi:diacylglycerol kinase (ATP)